MAYFPPTGSTVSFQSDPANLHASITGTVTVRNPQSVSGTVQTDVRGSVAVVIIGGSVAVATGNSSVQILNFPTNQSVSGAVSISNFPTTQNVSGSVVAFQGTPEWTVKSSLTGGIFPVSGSVAATITNTNVNVSGSVAAWLQSTNASVITVGTAAPNQSVSGTVQVDVRGSVATVIIGGSIATATTNSSVMLLNSANVIGSVTALQGTPEWTVKSSLAGGIFPISGSVAVGNFPTNQNVSGSVVAFQGGTQITSLVSTVPSSVIVGSSMFGQLPAGTAMLGSVVAYQGVIPWAISSIYGNVAGSVVSFQGTSPWVVNFQNSSIITVPSANSIVGTYAEDTAHTAGDRGIFYLGIRNDTIASLVASDLEYTGNSTDSSGRTVVKPFAPDETRFQYNGSVVSTSVTLVAASVIGKRQYITDFWISNTGASTSRVDFRDGSTSIVGQTIAPGGSGSNSPGISMPPRTNPSQDLTFQAITASSIIHVTVTGYTAP